MNKPNQDIKKLIFNELVDYISERLNDGGFDANVSVMRYTNFDGAGLLLNPSTAKIIGGWYTDRYDGEVSVTFDERCDNYQAAAFLCAFLVRNVLIGENFTLYINGREHVELDSQEFRRLHDFHNMFMGHCF